MKWIPITEGLPNRQCDKIFVTRNDIEGSEYINFTVTASYYPEKTILKTTSDTEVNGKGFGNLCCECGFEYFESFTPVAWAYIPEYYSDDWIKPENELPRDNEILYILRDKNKHIFSYCEYNVPKPEDDQDEYYFGGFGNFDYDSGPMTYDDVIAWMREPEPYYAQKPAVTYEDYAFDWRKRKPEHFRYSTARAKDSHQFIEEILELSKEIPVTKCIYVYDYGIKDNKRHFEVEIINKTEKPKEYIDGRTDFIIKGRKLLKGHFLDFDDWLNIFYGKNAIIDEVLTPREKAEEEYGQKYVDNEILKWLSPEQKKEYVFSSTAKRKFVDKEVLNANKTTLQECEYKNYCNIEKPCFKFCPKYEAEDM